jgi:hypothetical protein
MDAQPDIQGRGRMTGTWKRPTTQSRIVGFGRNRMKTDHAPWTMLP